MIFTSYYAKIKHFPEYFVPVAISRGIPKWYDGASYEKLAPLWSTVDTYKRNVEKDPAFWEKWYNEQYQCTVLDKLNPTIVARELQELVGVGKTPVLLCYEKSTDFCHRNLVAEWFGRANILAREVKIEDFAKESPKEKEIDTMKLNTKLIGTGVCIHCPTETLAKELLHQLRVQFGCYWKSEKGLDTLDIYSNYGKYNSDTVYHVHDNGMVSYCSLDYAKSKKYLIIEASNILEPDNENALTQDDERDLS